jgi:hypothetical protein
LKRVKIQPDRGKDHYYREEMGLDSGVEKQGEPIGDAAGMVTEKLEWREQDTKA